MSYVKNLIKSLGNNTASKITESDFCEIKNFYDTGVYILNGIFGGSFFKGIPSGVVSGLAGRQGSGKTYALLKAASMFLRANKDALCFIFESEGSYDKERVIKLVGEDVADRLIVIQVRTIEKFKTQIFNLLKQIEKDGNPVPVLLGLDSLGMLASEVDLEYAAKGENKRNMQKQQIIKSLFTIISEPLKKMDIPLIMTNHVYTAIGSYAGGDEISGGMGFKFACRNIIEMKKRKEKDDNKNHIGTGVTAIVKKGMYVAEDFTKVKFAINFKGGISKYSGLYDFILDNNIAKEVNKGSLGKTLIFEDFDNYEITKADRKNKTMAEIFHPEFLKYLDKKFQELFYTNSDSDVNEKVEELINEDLKETKEIIENKKPKKKSEKKLTKNINKKDKEKILKEQNKILKDDNSTKYAKYKAKKVIKELNQTISE